MPERHQAWLTIPCLLLLGCGDCSSNRLGKQTAHVETKAVTSPEPFSDEDLPISEDSLEDVEIFPMDERTIIPGGLGDSTNQYSSVVRVTASTASEKIRCNGVLIAPRLVLTAGHCVCAGTACIEDVTVTTDIYPATSNALELIMGARQEDYTGKVRPRYSLESLRGNDAAPQTPAPDLALVLLNRPVTASIKPIELANEDVTPGDSVIVVGYGQVERSDRVMGLRRFGSKKITSSSAGGGFLEPQGLAALNSGSGESCLHQDGRTLRLVGLVGTFNGNQPAFISVYYYRPWLISEIDRATKPRSQKLIP